MFILDSMESTVANNYFIHIPLLLSLYFQYWPGSRAERPIPSSALRGGGDGDPPCVLATGGGDLHI